MADPDDSRVPKSWQQQDLTKGPRTRIGLFLVVLAWVPAFAVIRDLSSGGDTGPGGVAGLVGGLLFLLCVVAVTVMGGLIFFGRGPSHNPWRLIGLELAGLALSYVVLAVFGFIKL